MINFVSLCLSKLRKAATPIAQITPVLALDLHLRPQHPCKCNRQVADAPAEFFPQEDEIAV